MRNCNYTLILLVLTFVFKEATAQNIGINSTGSAPDISAMLDVSSDTTGLLIPRIALTATNIVFPVTSPAVSLLVYNTATAGTYPNSVTPGYYYWSGTIWLAFETKGDRYSSVDAGVNVTTSSASDVVVTGMTITPGAGTYAVNFNGQCDIPDANYTVGINTSDLCTDLGLIYNDITALAVTHSAHAAAFGTGETLSPGVYSLASAISVAGTLTLNGGGDPNAVFVIRSTGGAITVGANVTVSLTGSAKSSNVYWVAEGAISVGATCTFVGTLLSNNGAVGSISVGTNTTLDGRMFSRNGAVEFGEGTLSVPTDPSFIGFRSLTNFVMFTCLGDVDSDAPSTYNGDISTNSGAITDFAAGGCTVNGTVYASGSTPIVTQIDHEATFSLYQNGVLISNTERTLFNSSVIYLQGNATVLDGEAIDVRWRIDAQTSDNGKIDIEKRILSVTKVQ